MSSVNLKIDKTNKQGNTYAKYEIYPFQRGYGHTFYTPLRRILLSSIKGASITRIKIKGVDHEFSAVKGIKEDVLRLTQNLAKVVFRLDDSEQETVTLKAHGKKVLTAGDIKVPGNVSITNKDFEICQLTDDKSELDVEIIIESGYGFHLADQEVRNVNPGWIPLNKNFSPVDKVNANVVPTRVGQKTDLEKIVLEIWTNGAVDTDSALKEAVKTLMERTTELYDLVSGFEDNGAEESNEEEVEA